ncbi:hypothetical protein Dxin01_03049 [Deinococcus xinjiangensis]|uniref:Phosphodiester glycosidase domain-containing protein n=1 Tax=Deinococcus xinjiangensis TaxID=457454 RepID=A0ABP9VDJ4_9DEIO
MRRLPLVSLLLLTACSHTEAASVSRVVSGGMLYIVATADPRTDQIRLHWLNPTTGAPYRTLAQVQGRLAKQGQQVIFATNSGIYAEGLKPLGLHIEQGETLVRVNNARSGGNFALLPNGVFWIDGGKAGVTETQAYKAAGLTPTYATQSGPLLVQGGKLHPQFNKGSSSFKLRSGVGVCKGGKVKFAVSAGPVNFYSFAVFFRDTLGCPDALYLDGSISAYATPETNTQLVNFAGIWTISK